MEQINQNSEKKSCWKKYRFLFIYTILILILLYKSSIGFFDIIFKIALLILVWIQLISFFQYIRKLQIPAFIGSSFIRQLFIVAVSIVMTLFLIAFTLLISIFIFGKGDTVEGFEFLFEVFSLSLVWVVFCIYLLFKWKLGSMLLTGSLMTKLVVLAITGLILYTPVVITNVAFGVFFLEGNTSGVSWDWDDD